MKKKINPPRRGDATDQARFNTEVAQRLQELQILQSDTVKPRWQREGTLLESAPPSRGNGSPVKATWRP